jgi:hypothetical protein
MRQSIPGSPNVRRSRASITNNTSSSSTSAVYQQIHQSEELGSRLLPDNIRIQTSPFKSIMSSIRSNRGKGGLVGSVIEFLNSTRFVVLLVLCLQNSLFTVLRRYSQGVLREVYSKVSYRICFLLWSYCNDESMSLPSLV